MYNWNIDIKSVDKKSRKFIIWRLNQLINFGLNGDRLNLKMVKKYWNNLSLDTKRKKFLSYIIWGKLS